MPVFCVQRNVHMFRYISFHHPETNANSIANLLQHKEGAFGKAMLKERLLVVQKLHWLEWIDVATT